MDKYILTYEEREYLGFINNAKGCNFAINNNNNQPKIIYLDCEFVMTENGEEIVVIGFGSHNNTANSFDDHLIKVDHNLL